MASNILAGDQLNFTRMGIASVDEIKVVLADILRCEIKPQDLPKSITSCSELTTGRHKLRPEQQRLCCPSPPAVPDYNKFDVSLLYTLIRNLCPQLKPTQDWGKPPSITEFQIGDDIERLRVFRNEMFAHLDSSCVEDVVFTSKWQDLEQIFQRMQTFLKSKGISVDYGKKLATIEKSDFGFEDMEKYKIILEGILHILKENDENGAVNIPPERFMAYMKKRKTTVRHARGIVVGCAGAGKTTLLYRLMGKSLDEIEEIKSTRELHVYEHIFFVRNGDLSATEDESSKKPLIRIPVSELEQKRNNKMEIEAGNEASFESIQAGKDDNTRQNTALASKKNDTDESHNVKIDQQLTGDVRRKDERNDQQLAKDVMGKILDATENEISISMIDFAGQFAYYACHQIYMRSEAFYILVLDMSKDFYEIICSKTDECEDSIFSTWTYEGYLNFWLDSIKSFSGTSAQVLVVATHTEGKTEEEKDSFWESLWALVPEEDKTRLYDRDFALGLIEMNEEGINTLQSLKKSIAEIVSDDMNTKIEVPSAWALLEHLLKKTEKHILSISDINKVNKELSEEYQLKNQEEIFDFLSFFHGHGMLLFFKEEGLKTHAILDIQWFSNAFSMLIADKKHINRDCKRRYIKEWSCYNATGCLSNSLVDALWKEEMSYIEHKTYLMTYMERLRMLVSIVNSKGEHSWYVPCMNNKPFTHRIFKQTLEKSSILCFRFKSFAMFVYYRLIAYCMSFLKWSVTSDEYGSECLYHTAAVFETKNHTVIVGIYDNDIQVQVLRFNNLQTKVSCEVGKCIEVALTELNETFDNKSFQKGYKCLNIFCSEKDPTFIQINLYEIEDFMMQCNCPTGQKHKIDVQETLGFWVEIDQNLSVQNRKARNENDDYRQRGLEEKEDGTIYNINIDSIKTSSGMVIIANSDNASVTQTERSSAKKRKKNNV